MRSTNRHSVNIRLTHPCYVNLQGKKKIRCCPSIAWMHMNKRKKRGRSLYTPDARHTVRIRRELWSSPHATVRTHNAHITANAALAHIWSIAEPIAAFLDCCALD